MQISRPKLVRLVAVGALVGSAALASVGTAGAAGGIKCATMTGNATTTVKLSNCTGNTGGGSKPIKGSSLATGGTIKWLNAKKTTVTLSVKAKGTACPAGSSEYQAKGTVTKDTTGSASPTVKGSVCLDATGNVSLVAGTKLTI